MNLDKVEEENEENENDILNQSFESMYSFQLPSASLKESLPEKENKEKESDNESDILNRSFESPHISLRESLPDDVKRPGSASLKDAGLDSDKKKETSKGKVKSAEKSSRKQTVGHGLKDRASTADAAPPPPPGPPPPPDPKKRGGAPPPPPAPDVKNVPTLPPIKFNAKDLKLSKKKLRNAKEILKMVDVERADMFDKYKKYKYMPMVDSREYLRTLRAEIVSISFDGIEQLTDAFLFSLHHCKLSLNSLRWISMSGCYNITDEGVYWITQAFPTLREIFLMGCRKVTEKAVYYLKSLNELRTIDVRGTDVGIVPTDLKALWVTLSGCPMISPAPACKQPIMIPSPYRKVVILTNQKLPWNPLAVLTNQKDLSPKQELLYHSDWSPFTDHKIDGGESSGKLFNVFQVPIEQGLSELIISPGSIVLIPYHLSDNVSVVEKTYILQLAETITSILTKHADCTYVLLGLYNGTLNFDPVGKSEEVVECVRRRLHDWNDRLGNNLRISIHTNWRMAALTFEEQESLATGHKFLRQSKSLYKEHRDVLHKDSKKPIRSLLGGVINIKEGVKNNLTFLVEAVEADEILFPWNRQKLQSQQVLDYGPKLQKRPLPLNKLQAVIKQYRIEDIGNENLYGHVGKLLSFATLTGHSLYYPLTSDKTVVTDFKFLAELFQQLFFKQAPRRVDIRALGKDVPCWTQEDMEKLCPKSKATMTLLLGLLEKYGCFLKVPLDPWSNLPGVSFVYVLYKDFPDKPTVPIDNYWVPELPTGETQRDKYYFCCPGLPESFFPNLLRHVHRLGWVVLLWRNGAIIQKGYVTILVEKLKEYQGLNVVLVQVRMPLTPQDNSPHLKTLWTTLKLYTCIMDYLVLKYKVSVAKAVACTSCIPSTNRYTILESKEMRRFFLEHLVRVGDQRDVRCKKCDSSSIAYVQIGPYINTSSLVPHHDIPGIALSTTNTFNRCLMCENCAVSGMKCPVNLTKGTSNWYCGCNIEGKLCNYCGMCQRCFMYIKKIVSTLEPAFVTPKVVENVGQEQIVALDTVNVVTKGSILGFIEVQKHQLDDEMTANYFPILEVTFIQQSGVFIELKMKEGETEKTLYYNTHYGTVLLNDQVMLENDERAACKEGDRIRITLDFCDDEYTQMLVQLECNDRHIYSLQVRAQRVGVAMTALQSGVSLQLTRPQKLRRQTEDLAEESPDSKKIKNCGYTVAALPSALEMRMYALLDNVEDTLFGDRGISFTGAGMVALPSVLSMATLQYPAMGSLAKSNYHHLCVTWNPKSGKKNVKLFNKDKFVSVIKREIKSELHDYTMNQWVSNVDQWNLSRLAHLLDAPGIPASEAATVDQNSSLLLWSWHYLLASYPAVFLPKNPQKLFPTGVYSETNKINLEEGLRQLFRLGFWKYFLNLDFGLIGTMYKSTGWGRRVEFLSNKNKLVAYALVIQELLDSHLDKTGLLKIKSKFNQKLDLYLCPGHRHCLKSRENLKEITPELHGDYGVFLSFIDFAYNKLDHIPENFFKALPNLVDLGIGFNHIDNLPSTIKHCRKLYSLQLMENDLVDLPGELAELENLSVLDLGNNRFIKIPDVVFRLTSLTTLTAPYMMLTEIPEDIGNLVNLKKLFLQGNCFSRLPKSFERLVQLEEINLAGVPWVKIKTSNVLSYDGFRFFLAGNKMDRYIQANDRDHEELFQFFDENSNGVLELNEVGKLNAAMFNLFPRFGYKGKEPPEEAGMSSGFPTVLFNCPNLRTITLDYQGIVSVPPEIERLKNLTDLRISNNPNLLSVPAQLGTLKSLRVLDLDNCPLLKTPPKEIRDKGFQSILAYLQRLLSGALLSKRTKLMLVGLGGAGKTSLVKSLMSKDGKADLSHGEDITDGIEINTWQISKDGEEITYNVWDFAGQTVYYNTHQFFLSNRAVYLLLWNVRLGYEHAGLDFWLSSISVQCPKVPIFVVGSHIDQVKKSELPIEEMLQRYPQIVGFHFVSSFTGQGIAELKEKIFNVTLQQEYMGEHIPAVWLTFENNIASNRRKHNVIEYRMLETIANQSGIFDSSEIFQAVQFLHDLGTIQHFTNEFLKDKVVINPQWIVDVMACVVSVKSQVIKDGRLQHSDIAEVWSEYPKNLHNWLLRLTEEFDLTFPLSNAAVNLVPCLLPEKKPEIDWPEVERGSDMKETQMIYKFDYLPAGLFNRGQVRLHQLSDSSLIWKKGSFLKKNVHIALIQQTRESELVVLVQGPRPENILFLVHEVFEGLIAESFNGVQYDFLLPCPECNKMAVKDQHMFAASTIRRAIEMKAPFLQCIKYFHTISCSDLLTFLPPDSHSDFDAHLVQSIQGLKDLKKDLSADIFISHCQIDDQADKSSMILPSRVYEDLKSKGYKCWYADNRTTASTDEMAKALIDCSVFVAFVSSNYANVDDCVNIFKYARLTLRKTMVVVAVGDGFDWKQSKIGILLADEVYINMTKPKYEHYGSKFEELLKALSGKTRMVTDVSPKPVVFFSYTWVNSEEAVELGTRSVPGAIGYGDPRKLKAYLEEHGVSCWIDVERVGMNGLFDDIAEGLLSARLVIVCVSDEYAASQTCQIEFRYAANTLKLPIIIAAVGTGDGWRATEVGLLSVHYPIVNFQEKTKNARKKLLKLVQDRFGEGEDPETSKAQKEKTNETHKNLSFQELFELAQRKLLRQLTIYAENQDTDIYPRLLLADFVKESVSDIDTSDSETVGELPVEAINGSEKKDESEKTKEDTDQTKETPPKPKPRLRQNVHKRLAKKSSTLQPAYKMQKFCVYILCEHDEGWHCVADPLELPYDFGINYLESFSPYLARMTAVMKYSKRLTLACLEDEIGNDYLKWLEESPEATMSDYQSVYHRFREMVMEVDADRIMGKLARCHLPNGKTIWLCPKHQKTARVTVLSNQEKTVNHKADHSTKVYSYMIQALRSMDDSQYASQFKTGRQSKRKDHSEELKELKKATKDAKKQQREEAKREKNMKKQQSSSDVQEASKTSVETSEASKSEITDDKRGADRQISKESSISLSTDTASRQTSVTSTDRQISKDSVESVSSIATPRQSSQNWRDKRGAGRQQSQDQASISSRDSTASLQRHRDQSKYSESTKTIQRAKNKSRACVIS